MDRSNIEKIAQTPEDKLLLAKVWDKIYSGLRRDIPTSTAFLSPRELALTTYLFGSAQGITPFGGYDHAERKMLVYLPEYLDESYLRGEDAPIVCLRATFHPADVLSHRDFLGALMGAGIARETVGDICVGTGTCDFFVTREIAPYITDSLLSAGRTRLHIAPIPFSAIEIPEPETQEIRDTVASLRLDSIIASGFRIGRTAAAAHITAGKASLDGIPCEKPDKTILPGSKISVRGLGKILLRSAGGQTRKGRIGIIIDRYI